MSQEICWGLIVWKSAKEAAKGHLGNLHVSRIAWETLHNKYLDSIVKCLVTHDSCIKKTSVISEMFWGRGKRS